MSLTSRLFALSVVLVLAPVLAGCDGGVRFVRQPNDAYSCVTATNFSKCRIEREQKRVSPTDRGGRP